MLEKVAWATTSHGAIGGYGGIVCNSGCVLRTLRAVSSTSLWRFAVRRELLIFLCEGFGGNVTLNTWSEMYADAYISFHFFSFLSILRSGLPGARHSAAVVADSTIPPVGRLCCSDPPLLQLARLHLLILLAFAADKSADVARKFYRLRVLRCLALQARPLQDVGA